MGAVVLVSHDGKLVYQRAAGLADRESKRPMEISTVFRLSSVSKPIVSAAALALVDKGKLSLNDPVTKYLPDFRPKLASGEAPTITVRQLLTHTSGLGYKFAEKPGTAYYKAGVSDGFDELRISLNENMQRLATAPLFGRPGEAFRYSLSIDVLGAVVEKASGKALPEAVAELVTQPLGMRDTAFWAKQPARLATPYYDSKPAPARMTDPLSIPFGEGGRLMYSPSRALDPKAYPSGGAGMVGTAPDLMRFFEAVRTGGKPILSAATAASDDAQPDRFVGRTSAGRRVWIRRRRRRRSGRGTHAAIAGHVAMGRRVRSLLVRGSRAEAHRCRVHEHRARRHVGQVHHRPARRGV